MQSLVRFHLQSVIGKGGKQARRQPANAAATRPARFVIKQEITPDFSVSTDLVRCVRLRISLSAFTHSPSRKLAFCFSGSTSRMSEIIIRQIFLVIIRVQHHRGVKLRFFQRFTGQKHFLEQRFYRPNGAGFPNCSHTQTDFLPANQMAAARKAR